MKKVLVTGSAGFIGYHIIKRLINMDCDILGIDNLNEYYSVKLKEDRLLDIGDKLVFKKVGAYTICLTPIFIEAFPKVYVRNEDNRYECVRDSWDVNEYLQKSVF